MNIQENCEKAVKLFKEVFGKEISIDNFIYKHFANPYKIDQPMSYYFRDKQLVGMYGCMRQELQVGFQKVYGIYCCDVAISPKHKNGVYFNLLNAVLNICKNEASYLIMQRPSPVHSRILEAIGFHFLGNVATMLFEVDTPHLLSNNEIEIFDNCPFLETDYDAINRAFHTGVYRTERYFKWKVDNNSYRNMKYVICRNHEQITGYFIIEIANNVAKIVDWVLINNSDDVTFHALLDYCIMSFPYIKFVKIKCVNDQNGENIFLENIGFKTQKAYPVFWLGLKSDIQLIGNNCMMRELDEDGMLQKLT